ncbi:3-hydroxyacyl-CoA dehydrogenase NAD-binding domain-containing protein [Baia soyae]|nr:3-hydroxyacyl-CoA dehydrogenase NAD-binding domain-containing protein [Baia soyae]
MTEQIWRSPAVIGTGTMGRGIIDMLITAGYQVKAFDNCKKSRISAREWLEERWWKLAEKGKKTLFEVESMQERLVLVDSLQDLSDCDLILEAVPEDLLMKRNLFHQLDSLMPADTVLATNTSSLSVTSISSRLKHPERVIGLHFFNPVWRLPLVEVVESAHTPLELIQQAMSWLQSMGKEPIHVLDTPGFIVNRVARPFHLEAYRIVGEGSADKNQVDRILRSAGFPMGPFELQDLIGIDINYSASHSVYEGFHYDPRFRPHPEQRALVESGKLGRKSGKGHYIYE